MAVDIDGRRLISTEEAAEIAGITVNNFRQKVHLKLIFPITRKGRRVYFDELDAIALRHNGRIRKKSEAQNPPSEI